MVIGECEKRHAQKDRGGENTQAIFGEEWK